MKYVYMLRAGESYYKVGIASNVVNRIKSIQTANPSKIQVVTTNLVANAPKLERQLHLQLAGDRTDGGTEWFKLTADQAIELAIKLNEATGVDVTQTVTLKSLEAEQVELNRKMDQVLRVVETRLLKVPIIDEPETRTMKSVPETFDDDKPDPNEMLQRAIELVREERRASTSMLQRRLSIGYGRASRIMDEMEALNIIGAKDGARARIVFAA